MSKNTDFYKLVPYSRKNSIRTGTGTNIGQTESNRPKRPVHTRTRAGSVRSCTRKCASRRPHVRQPLRSRGLADPVRLDFAGDTCRRLAGAALLQPTVDVCPALIAALCRSPADLFFFSFFLLCLLKSVTQSSFSIFISFDPLTWSIQFLRQSARSCYGLGPSILFVNFAWLSDKLRTSKVRSPFSDDSQIFAFGLSSRPNFFTNHAWVVPKWIFQHFRIDSRRENSDLWNVVQKSYLAKCSWALTKRRPR